MENNFRDIVKPIKYKSVYNNPHQRMKGIKHTCNKCMKRKRNIILKININKLV